MSKVVQLPIETLNKALNVLSGLPYSQVADVIQEVQAMVKIVDEPTETVTETSET